MSEAVARGDAEIEGRSWIMSGRVLPTVEFELYSVADWESLKDFTKRSNMIRFLV